MLPVWLLEPRHSTRKWQKANQTTRMDASMGTVGESRGLTHQVTSQIRAPKFDARQINACSSSHRVMEAIGKALSNVSQIPHA